MVNIIDVNWEEGDQSRAEAMISEEISRVGGEIESIGGMGRRQLAYPIEDHLEGIYLLTLFSGPPEGITLLQNRLKLNPAVIRTLIVRAAAPVKIEIDEPVPETADASSHPAPDAVPPQSSVPPVSGEQEENVQEGDSAEDTPPVIEEKKPEEKKEEDRKEEKGQKGEEKKEE